MTDLAPFRFEVTDDRLVATDYWTMKRAQAIVDRMIAESGGTLTVTADPIRYVTIASGEAPREVISVIAAIAQGHDLEAVLDLIGQQHP